MRNHSLIGFMVRKHLDYVSRFKFSINSGIPELDSAVKTLFRWHGKPNNFDFMGRLGREESFRLFELEKVVNGDAGFIKIDDECKLQAIESDLITKATGAPDSVNDEGLVCDDFGRITDYAICRRVPKQNKPVFDHLEPKNNIIFDGYWGRFSSQNRGVSPLSSALTTIADLHESFSYNLLKAKMQALFGLAITRDSANGDFEAGSTGGIDFSPNGLTMVDLLPGEDVKMLESKSPSTEFISGSYLFIHLAMIALDIPITSFDSRRSSFSARIADLNEYEVSTDYKRQKNKYARQEYSDWLLAQLWDDARFSNIKQIATKNKLSLFDVCELVKWVPAGSPWLDKKKQVQGDQISISLGLDNPVDACRRRGGDVFENIDKIAEVQNYAKSKDVTINSGAGLSIDDELEDAIQEALENKLEEDGE